jgi:hypothetical protein
MSFFAMPQNNGVSMNNEEASHSGPGLSHGGTTDSVF